MSDVRAQVSAMSPGEFRVGLVLSRASTVWTQDSIKFFLIALVAVSPAALLAVMGSLESLAGLPVESYARVGIAMTLLISFSSIFFYALSQAVTLYGAFQDMRGRPFALGEAVARAFRRFFPLLGLAIAWGVAIFFGLLVLIVPGLMLIASFYVALPACVVEELGPLQSMSRSAALTKGHRWKVFGLFILIFIASTVVGLVIRVVALRATGPIGSVLAGLVWNALFASYNSVVISVMYHDLRVLKDGVDIDRIAAVFD